MRVWLLVGVMTLPSACGGGGAAAPATVAPTPTSTPTKHVDDAAPIDPIAALAPADRVSYLVPGRVQIDLGATAIEGPGGNKPIQVSLIGRQGNQVRAAVRLEHARFSLWTDRGRLLSVVKSDFNMQTIYRPNDETRAVLHAGAVVRRLKHENKRTQVRYVGAVEVEGWIPDDMLVDEGPPRDRPSRFPRPGRLRPQHVFPGAVIRREPRWTADQLAVVAMTYTLDTIREIDQAWAVIAYDDADVSVQGYVSRRDPPGRVHKPKDPEVAPQKITANGKVPSGTCLYTQVKGDAVGYIVGDQDVMLDDVGAGWWTLTIDSPWGPIPFAAQGPTRTDLVGCAPAGSVPASALNPQPPAPAP
ncbi:MAG: hypothetical protein M4D80_18585 [Myxococcota bacterium]|nr:hypothetical protein [Myxococcota bacterium]